MTENLKPEQVPRLWNRRMNQEVAQRLGKLFDIKRPMAWAEEMFRQHQLGHMRVSDGTMADQDGVIIEQTKLQQQLNARAENALRMRAMIKAIRQLRGSKDPQHAKMVDGLIKHLAHTWGVKKAADVVGGNDRDLHRELLDLWGDAPIPPADAMLGELAADELFIRNVVRRVS